MKQCGFLDPEIVKTILKKIDRPNAIKDLRLITFSKLYKFLEKDERLAIKKFLSLDPRRYGFKGKFFGIQNVPSDIVKIRKQRFFHKGRAKTINEQLLPGTVYKAYRHLNSAIKKDIGKSLLVASGYRSPAYQIIVFLSSFEYTGFDFRKTVRWAAFPGYSEHSNPQRQAIDFMTEEGVPEDDDLLKFGKTIEFKWLIRNANKFGFYLSYPKKNKDGVMYEPWHWHFEKKERKR